METASRRLADLPARHLRVGWWSLFAFLLLGLGLEAMHGLKLRWFLDVGNETRRLLLGLAHAHGVLLALVNVAFAGTLWIGRASDEPWARRASSCLLAAGVLLPAGFGLGGLVIYGGDPGPGIALVPLGAILLAAGVWITARGLGASRRGGGETGVSADGAASAPASRAAGP